MRKFTLLILAAFAGGMTANAEDYLKGSWDGWANATQFTYSGNIGKLSLTLNASTNYTFKFLNSETYMGNGGTMTSSNCIGWGFDSKSGDCTLTTTIAGDYEFIVKWDNSTPKISVIYPVSNQYTIHFKKGDNWSSVYAHRYVYLSGNTLDLTSWPGIQLSENENNSGYYDVTFSDSYNYIVFNDNGSDTNKSGNVAVNFGYPETWVTDNATISTTAPSDWVGYTREVTSGNFGTICLPFAATVTGATVYQIASKVMENSSLTGINLESVNALEAGKAYIFKATSSTLTASYTGSYADATEANGMLGNLSAAPVTVPSGNYVVGSNQLHEVEGNGVTVGQYKAYITLTDIPEAVAGARGSVFMAFDDEATGIEGVQAENAQGAIYNLQGQRVMDSHKGLVIINGKKMLNK